MYPNVYNSNTIDKLSASSITFPLESISSIVHSYLFLSEGSTGRRLVLTTLSLSKWHITHQLY